MKLSIALFTASVMALCAACNGKSTETDKPVKPSPAPKTEENNQEPVSADFLFELKAYFDRRRFSVARCYGDAVAAKELSRSSKGGVNVGMIITPQGRAKNVRIVASDLNSKVLEQCIVDQVKSWDYPKPSRDVEYSHPFLFQGG